METQDLPGTQPASPKLLDRVRDAIRMRHYSYRTEETYIHWIKRFIYFHGKRHPKDMGEAEVTAFLNHLSRERTVAAATQNQALAAILFLYCLGGLWAGWRDLNGPDDPPACLPC